MTRLLVIGGTVFVGRAVVEEALVRGYDVTVFHRGHHGADLFDGDVERVLGERRGDLHRLAGLNFDLVVDTCAFHPADVTELRTERYAFVSSGSAYRDWPERPVTVDSPLHDDGEEYGPGKAATERALEALMPGRVVHARAGVIVGPHENIGRLPYWIRRCARGGRVLAPLPREAPLQWIDVRDLATFLLDAEPGAYNAVGPPGMATWGEVLDACAAGTSAELVWTEPGPIAERVANPWVELPLWPAPHGAIYEMAASVAVRPVEETVADTRAWLEAGGELAAWREELRATGLDSAVESELLG